MVNLYWRSDKWSCRSENYISLEGLRKYFTLFPWHRPRFALSIRSIRRMVDFDWRSDKWSCRSENYISLEGLRKYFTLFPWHRPRFALSIRSIRSIRRMVNFDWRFNKWSCRSEKCIPLEGLRKYFTSSRGKDPVLFCRFDRFVQFVEWWIFIEDPTIGVVDRKITSQ